MFFSNYSIATNLIRFLCHWEVLKYFFLFVCWPLVVDNHEAVCRLADIKVTPPAAKK